jgi:hypothetical protein
MTHFFADFVLQSRDMGKKKSSEPKYLFAHLAIQFVAFALVATPCAYSRYHHLGGAVLYALIFSLTNAAIHGIIDWNIWRLYKAYAYKAIQKNPQHPLLTGNPAEPWKFWEDHMFYTTIGFDQMLHGLTLVILAGVFHL